MKLEKQLEQPLTTLRTRTGCQYDWMPDMEQAIQDRGFRLAVLAYPRWFDPADRYRLSRWSVSTGGDQLDHILSGLAR